MRVPHASTRVGASHASSSSAAAGRWQQHGARPGPSSTPLAARAAHWVTTTTPTPTTIDGRVAAVGVRVSPLLPSHPHETGPAEGVRCCQRPLPSHHRRRRRRRRCCLPGPCGRTHPATFAAWVLAPPPPLPRWWRDHAHGAAAAVHGGGGGGGGCPTTGTSITAVTEKKTQQRRAVCRQVDRETHAKGKGVGALSEGG
jgi:hypothetical protein